MSKQSALDYISPDIFATDACAHLTLIHNVKHQIVYFGTNPVIYEIKSTTVFKSFIGE